MLISNFTVGFSTSASIEAELMGTPFISLWKHERHDKEFNVTSQNLEFFYENFDKVISLSDNNMSYRVAQSENTFIVKNDPVYEYNRIKDNLDLFLQSMPVRTQFPKFEVHPLWEEIY